MKHEFVRKTKDGNWIFDWPLARLYWSEEVCWRAYMLLWRWWNE